MDETKEKTKVPKNLDGYLEDLLIFGRQVNRRSQPDGLWYSEMLLTTQQKKDYDKAEKKLRKAFKRLETIWSGANHKNR